MKINSIAISNLYSFPHLNNFETQHEPIIEFNDDLNILIGPNGSGKSNFMEILNEIFQEAFVGNKEYSQYPSSQPIGHDSFLRNPNKHWNNGDKATLMLISIELSDIDKKNLKTLIDNLDTPELTKLLITPLMHYNNFSVLGDWISKVKNSEDTRFIPTKLSCFFDMDKNQLIGTHTNITLVEYFIYDYLRHFLSLQKTIINTNVSNKIDWQSIQNTFVLIKSTRKYSFDNQIISYGVRLESQNTKNESLSDNLFEMVLSKWGKVIKDKRDISGLDNAKKEINEKIANISDILTKYINLSIRVDNFSLNTDTAELLILLNEKPVRLNSLSTGQKSIFYLIFSIYGLELENALVLIDEPELHLHPELQKKYLKLLKKASKERGLQIILSTHSPVFIDEETIKNTFRFYKESDDTKIIVPEKIEQKDKELLQILTYTNSARIFFANKVILVEGESDEYFFKFFYENYFLEKHPDIKDAVEIIHIGGKKNVEKWQKFLKKFKIDNYFIGDLDNIQEQGIVSKDNYDSMIKQGKEAVLEKMKKKFKNQTSDDGKAILEALDKLISNNFEINEEAKSELISLWTYLLGRYASGALEQYFNNYPSKYEEVKNKIDEKYSDRIYILKQGDLEAYLGKSKDKLKNVIDFCKNEDFVNEIERSRLNELEGILEHIFMKTNSAQ